MNAIMKKQNASSHVRAQMRVELVQKYFYLYLWQRNERPQRSQLRRGRRRRRSAARVSSLASREAKIKTPQGTPRGGLLSWKRVTIGDRMPPILCLSGRGFWEMRILRRLNVPSLLSCRQIRWKTLRKHSLMSN